MNRVLSILLVLIAPLAAPAVDHERAHIAWDPATLRLVSEHSGYARIIRLRSGELLCGYERARQSCVKRSADNGNSWDSEVTVTDYQYGSASNTELLQLRDGRVLLCYNERPKVEGHPYTIMTTVSEDEGRTWSEPQCLYTAGETWEDGCWEPVALQYPDGEVQIFFANEAPYTETNEQEISMISTRDPKKVYTVSFRANARDGMSVPCLLNDGKTVVIAIEDSRWNDEPGRMKPVILTSSVRSRWTGSTVSADSSRRHYALKEPLPADTYLGAPYIVQMPTGITVLSAQLENQYGVQQMMVYLGDEKAGDFVNGSKPFLLSRAAPGMWNSLFVKDENTVTAVSQTKIDGTNGIWIIDGKIEGL